MEKEEKKENSINHSNNNNIINNHINNNNISSNNSDNESDNEYFSIKRLEIGTLYHNELDTIYMKEELIDKHCTTSSWSNADGTTFNVRRGPNYTSGQKAPSKKALYKVFAMDAYKTSKKINSIWKYINIRKYIKKYKIDYNHKLGYDLPPIIIINLMVPNYEPSMMGGDTNGEGFQLIFYARISDEVRQELNNLKIGKIKQKDLKPSIKLFSKFIHSKKNDKLRQRFKVIGKVMNPNKCEINYVAKKLVQQYNGKPFLARTSSTFYHSPGKYFAADIDGHLFGFLSRKGLYYIKPGLPSVIFDAGFVIEGHTDDELPEQMLCCCRGSRLGISDSKEFKFDTKLVDDYEKNSNNRRKSSKHSTNKNNENGGMFQSVTSIFWGSSNDKNDSSNNKSNNKSKNNSNNKS